MDREKIRQILSELQLSRDYQFLSDRTEAFEEAIDKIIALFPRLATKQINDVIEEYYSEVNKLSDNELWKFCRSEKVGDIIRKLGKIPTPATDKCLACQNGKIVVEVISGECDIKDCPQCLGTGLAAPSKDICGICGGKQVKIRGRYPKTSDRLVCPTCCQERLERINHISDKNYGIACQEVK